MPSLDLSDAFDPSFLDIFVVFRRKENIDDYGRSVITTTQMNVAGVVTVAATNDLQRLPDYQEADGGISIVTRFKLYEEARELVNGTYQDFQPDLIQWAGSIYVVKSLDDYTRFGFGWTQAICIEQKYVGTPPSGIFNS